MLRFCCLGSGSEGNATVVEAGDGLATTRVLLDNGFNGRQLRLRLARAGLGIDDLDAVVLTHEHSDHVGGVRALLRHSGLPVYCSSGTARAASLETTFREVVAGEIVAIGALRLMPFPVAHDAAEPLQYVFGDGERRLGVLTDVGAPGEDVINALAGVEALLLECNHDVGMLRPGGVAARSARSPPARAGRRRPPEPAQQPAASRSGGTGRRARLRCAGRAGGRPGLRPGLAALLTPARL
ncbi:MAG: beta-lactamase domain protein [Burkholderiaceae bacterium]|nr:beta-lactamase domain protein [Burkholderiaceae bacterium]